MERSPAEPSDPNDDGGLDRVVARLGLWCKREAPGLAQVEFIDESVRRLVVERLRGDLGAEAIPFTEITLSTETSESPLTDQIIDRLRDTPAGVVSVEGFAVAFPLDAPKLADSIYRLNVKRESLVSRCHRQIWWVPTYLAELLEKTAPDLESWIQLKLRLTLVAPARRGGPWDSAVPMAVQAMKESPTLATDPLEARRNAQDVLRRFRRAVGQGTPPIEAIRSLVWPAAERLRHATLTEEAQKLERKSVEIALQVEASKGPLGAESNSLDVFISYAGGDMQWAVWLDFVLRDAGYATSLQEYDFTPGDSFPRAIHEALIASRIVACLLSPAYLASRWCSEEWQTALTKRKLFPVRIADCNPDGLLTIQAYVDAVGLSEGEAEKRILDGLAKLEGRGVRPKHRPAFPNKDAASTRPAFPGKLPPIWNIPEARNPYFTGRDEMLRRLHEDLVSCEQAALTQAISGLGGVGKTQLALEYAYRHANEYEGVWWLRAETPATLAEDYAGLAPSLGIAVVADQDAVIRDVRESLIRRHGILLIFDNATGADTLTPYLPVGPGNRVLVTTREQYWPGATTEEVPVLELGQAVRFLLDRSGQSDQAAAQDIANRLGCLPLALEQAAAYVARCRKSLADYAALLEARGLEVLQRGRAYQYEQTVGTTWEMAFEKLKAENPGAVDLLYLCAFFAPEAIHLEELAGAKAHVPEALGNVLADEVALDQAKADLLGFSLIHSDGESIHIHRLVSEVIRRRMARDERERWLRAALRVVNAIFPPDADDVRSWPRCSIWLAHALTVVEWDEAEAADASACSNILNNVGGYLGAQASYGKAEVLFRRAVAIIERTSGPNHPSVAVRLNNLAGILHDTNRIAEAEPLYRRALAIDEQNLGPNHPDVASRLNNLAGLLHDMNRMSEAEPLYRRALAIAEQTFGPNHPRVAICLSNLAGLFYTTNQMAEAEVLFRRALTIDEKSFGPDHPDVANRLNNLAGLLHATNRMTEAEPLYRRALTIDEQSLGPNHPNVAIRLNNLGMLLQDTSRLAEAEPLLRRALAIDERSLGANHPSVARELNNLGMILRDQKRLAEAEPLFRRALAIDEIGLGPKHPRVAPVLNNLALLLQDTDHCAEAETFLRRALAILEQGLGPNHPQVASSLNNLAMFLRKANRPAEAEPLFRRALAIAETSLAPGDPHISGLRLELAAVHAELAAAKPSP
jgi:tetratricopeptide (TPR) repeat protein